MNYVKEVTWTFPVAIFISKMVEINSSHYCE